MVTKKQILKDIKESGEMRTLDIAKKYGVNSTDINQKLMMMYNFGILTKKKRGMSVYYSLPETDDSYGKNTTRGRPNGQKKGRTG